MSNPVIPPNVIEALKKGNKIEAIKLLREVRSVGLAEAKNLLEWYVRQDPALKRNPGEAPSPPHARPTAPHTPPTTPHHHPQYIGRPGLSPGEVPRSGGGATGFAIAMAIVAAVAAYFFLR